MDTADERHGADINNSLMPAGLVRVVITFSHGAGSDKLHGVVQHGVSVDHGRQPQRWRNGIASIGHIHDHDYRQEQCRHCEPELHADSATIGPRVEGLSASNILKGTAKLIDS